MKDRGIIIVAHVDSGKTTCIEHIEAKTNSSVFIVKEPVAMQIKNYHVPLNLFTPPLTRKERRKKNRKK